MDTSNKKHICKPLIQPVLLIKDRTSSFYITWRQYVDMDGQVKGLGQFNQQERKRQCGMGMGKRIHELRTAYKEKEQLKSSRQ